MSVDLIVAGGGPAGLATAIGAASAGLGVVVFEPRSGPIDKACGEGIMPAGVAALARLGVRPHGRSFVGVRYADAHDPKLGAVGAFCRHRGLGVRRTELHQTLWDAARTAGVRIRPGRVTTIEETPDHVTALGVRARWLVGADGIHSRVRSIIGASLPRRLPERLGLRRHYRVAPWSDCVEVYFGAGAEAYVTPISEDLVGVAILFARAGGSPHDFDTILTRFPLLARRLPAAAAATRTRGAGPFEQRVRRPGTGRVLLVGDAAGYLDPLTGEGVALGLATAEAAVAAISRAPDVVRCYTTAHRRLTRSYFALTAGLLGVARRRALHRLLLGAVAACPGAFGRILDHLGCEAAIGEPERGRLLRPEAHRDDEPDKGAGITGGSASARGRTACYSIVRGDRTT